jgi:hypothetical protein
MKIVFDNGQEIPIILHENPVKLAIEKVFKHLQHVALPFRPWDNPFYQKFNDYNQLVEALIIFGKKLDIQVDVERCLRRDQDYYNKLHKIFEQGYNGNPDWLDFHEHIHFCESHTTPSDLVLYHRELAAQLIKPIDLSWLENASTVVQSGDVYVTWAELGKNPYQYWKDQEPDNFKRLCDLAKPWLNFFPRLSVTLESKCLWPQDLNSIKRIEFESWWQEQSGPWCRHWHIDSWSLEDMYSGIVIGKLNVDQLKHVLEKKHYPIYIKLH